MPYDIIKFFDLVEIKELEDKECVEMRIYLDEKLAYTEGCSDGELESKGFFNPVYILDFPIRDKKVVLVLRKRKCRVKKNNKTIVRDLDIKQ